VPVEFLTDEQAESYGTFAQEPTRPELERFFFLDDEDRRLIGKRRGNHSRLGFSLQICTVRYVGLFLQDPLAVPWSVVEYLAERYLVIGVWHEKEFAQDFLKYIQKKGRP
jgi:TnpA family transposase